MTAMIEKLSDPTVLFALAFAFYLGFRVRGWGHNSPSPSPMTQQDMAGAVESVTVSRWMEIGAEIDARRKISAIKLLRTATGLGLKDSKEAIEARMAERGMDRR